MSACCADGSAVREVAGTPGRTNRGVPFSAKTVRKLIEDQMGKQPDMTEKDLVTLFVTSMAVQVPSAIKMRSVRPYKFDMAMKLAAQRSQVQPSMIGVNSKKEISR